MAETGSENGSEIWKKFLRKHWNMVVLFVVGAILVSIGAILVYLWYVGYAQLTSLIPATLGLWTMGYLVTFLLHVILLPFLLIGVPIILAAVVILWLWWKKLPDEEKKDDGNWNVAFATWTFDYLVYSYLSVLIWGLIIFGIPMVLGVIWWIRHEMKKKP